MRARRSNAITAPSRCTNVKELDIARLFHVMRRCARCSRLVRKNEIVRLNRLASGEDRDEEPARCPPLGELPPPPSICWTPPGYGHARYRRVWPADRCALIPTLAGTGAARRRRTGDACFRGGSDGVQLSSDNEVHTLHLRTSPDRRVLFNDTRVDSLGCMLLADVTIIGVAPKGG